MKKSLKVLFFISFFVFFVAIINVSNTAIETYAEETEYELGDIDQTGEVDANDALKCLRIAVRINECSDEIFKLADINFDNKIGAIDAYQILKYAAKLIDSVDEDIPIESTDYYNSKFDEIEKTKDETFIVSVVVEEGQIPFVDYGVKYDNLEILSFKYATESKLHLVLALYNDIEEENLLLASGIAIQNELYEGTVFEIEVRIKDKNQEANLCLFADSSNFVSSVDDCVIIDEVQLNQNVFATPTPTHLPEIVDYMLGDVDDSGVINANDALKVLKNAAKIELIDEESLVAADVDKSGQVDAQDSLYILQYAARIIVRFVFTPEENIPIIKEYIKENGVHDGNGSYKISYDYVENDDSSYSVEIDSFEYNEKVNSLIYKYDVSYTDELGEYSYSYIVDLREEQSAVRLIYFEDSEDMNLDIDVYKSFENSEIKFADDFNNKLIKNKYIAELKNASSEMDKEQFENDNKKFINAMMHMSLVSMEDYLQNSVVVSLKNLGFSSYQYSDEMFYEVMSFLYGIDIDIVNNMESIKQFISKKGEVSGDEVFLSELGWSGGVSGNYVHGYGNGDTYLVYNKTEDVIYFTGTYVTTPSNHIISLYLQPFSDRYTYCYALVYEPDDYDTPLEYEAYIKSNKIMWNGTYDFECLYPENGEPSVVIKDVLDFGVFKLSDIISYIFTTESSFSNKYSIKMLGLINM